MKRTSLTLGLGLVVATSSLPAHAKCIVLIDYCLNPNVNVAAEVAKTPVQNDNVTCMAKAEELKQVCQYRGPVVAYFIDSAERVVQKARFIKPSFEFRTLEANHFKRRMPHPKTGAPKPPTTTIPD